MSYETSLESALGPGVAITGTLIAQKFQLNADVFKRVDYTQTSGQNLKILYTKFIVQATMMRVEGDIFKDSAGNQAVGASGAVTSPWFYHIQLEGGGGDEFLVHESDLKTLAEIQALDPMGQWTV